MAVAALAVAFALFAQERADTPPVPAVPAASAPAPEVIPGDEIVFAELIVGNSPPATFVFGMHQAIGLKAYAIDPEGREGLRAIVGGHGRTPSGPAKSGVSFLFFLYLYADGGEFLEAQILNDAMSSPPGKVELSYRIQFRGAQVAAGKQLVYDQTGIGFSAGTVQAVPKQDRLEKYAADLPDPALVTGVDLRDAEPQPDPDPVKNTHQTGSPRNSYWSTEAAKWIFTKDARYLARLIDFTTAQARRPYHLSEPNGVPFQHEKYPDAWFIEGRPELLAYRQTFDRLLLPKGDNEGCAYNGWDHEHLNVEELYAAWLLTGSRVARRELVLIAEQLLSTAYVRDDRHGHGSGRSFGWVARGLVRAYQATGLKKYLEGARRMIRGLEVTRVKTGPYPALVPMEPRADHMKDHKFESVFHVAVATSALALYLREDPADSLAKELLLFCGDLLVDQGWSQDGKGFWYDYSVDSSDKSGTPSTDGTSQWAVSALVDVAEFASAEKQKKYLEPARIAYQANKAKGYATPAHWTYYKWFLKAARAFERQK